MTAMRDIFIAASKIKKSSAYKFTPLDGASDLRHLVANSAFIPLGGNIFLDPPLIDRHLAVNVKYFRAIRAFIKLTKDFYEIHPYPFGSIVIGHDANGICASGKTGCVCTAVIGKAISP